MTDDDRPEALSVRSARRADHVAELAWSGHGEPGAGFAASAPSSPSVAPVWSARRGPRVGIP